MELKNVVFNFPCTVTGGGQYLFIRYSKALAKYHPELNVYFIDYRDGFAHQEIGNDPYIKFIDYEDGIKTVIPENSIVVYTLNHLYHHLDYMIYNQNNTTFLFWCIAFHDLSIRKYFVSNSTKRNIGDLYIELTRNHVVKHLGPLAHNKIALSFCVKPIETNYIPLVIPFEKYGNKQVHSLGTPIRFCWLGRLDFDKYNDIVTYMNELEFLSKEYLLTFSLIGIGSAEKKIKDLTLKYSFPCSFVGEKRNEDLDVFIRDHTDIGLASGTSSLEFAMRGRQVIQVWSLDRVYQHNECKCFHYVEEKMDAEKSHPKRCVIQNESTFSDKFIEIINHYEESCGKAYDYAKKHSPEATSDIMYQTLVNICHLDIPATNNKIGELADLLSDAKKEPNLIKWARTFIRKIKNLI